MLLYICVTVLLQYTVWLSSIWSAILFHHITVNYLAQVGSFTEMPGTMFPGLSALSQRTKQHRKALYLDKYLEKL